MISEEVIKTLMQIWCAHIITEKVRNAIQDNRCHILGCFFCIEQQISAVSLTLMMDKKSILISHVMALNARIQIQVNQVTYKRFYILLQRNS